MVGSRSMQLLTVLGFALAAVAALPAACATNAPTGHIAFSLASGSLPNTDIPNADIYAVDADGSGLVRLTDDPVADFDPSWSPDGRRIAYRHEDERSGQIYVMNADGSRRRVPGLVAGRKEDRLRPHLWLRRLGHLGDERRRLPREAADRFRGDRAGSRVVAGREDDRLPVRPRRTGELRPHLARPFRRLEAASPDETAR
jgi:dipeptidyl aminopeptidase/acylaminoacyl peptidase